MVGGRLSDPNINPSINPSYLATLVFVGSNQKVYMPPVPAIWQRYLRKSSKNGKLLEDEDPELGCTQDVTPGRCWFLLPQRLRQRLLGRPGHRSVVIAVTFCDDLI